MSRADQLVIVYFESKDVDEHIEDEGEFLQCTLKDDREESNRHGASNLMRSNTELQDLEEELECHVAKPEDGGVRPGNLPEHNLNPRRKLQHQTILKKGHLSVGVRKAVGMAALHSLHRCYSIIL